MHNVQRSEVITKCVMCFAGSDRPSTGSKGQQRSTGGRDRGDNRRDRERGERDDRPPRGPRTGRPRLSSKEKVSDNKL